MMKEIKKSGTRKSVDKIPFISARKEQMRFSLQLADSLPHSKRARSKERRKRIRQKTILNVEFIRILSFLSVNAHNIPLFQEFFSIAIRFINLIHPFISISELFIYFIFNSLRHHHPHFFLPFHSIFQ